MKLNFFKASAALSLMAIVSIFGVAYVNAQTSTFVCDSANESPVQTLRNFFWVAMGFPGADEYRCFTDVGDPAEEAEIKKLVKPGGFVGDINTLRDMVSTAIQASGVTSCQDIPTTGSILPASGQTITYGMASRLPPTNFPHQAAYDKKVTYTDGGRMVEFEFHCNRASMMVKITGALANGHPQTLVVFYDGEHTSSNSDKYISFFIRDEGNFDPEFNMGVSLIVHSNDKYEMWMTRTGFDQNDDFTGYRFAASGDSYAKNFSIHYHDVSGAGLDKTTYANASDIDSVDVANGVKPQGANGAPAKGCAQTFATHSENITADTLCAGLTLVAHPENTLQTGSKISMKWMTDSFNSWIDAL